MSEGAERTRAEQLAENTDDTPSTSAKESNENDIQMKPLPAAFEEEKAVKANETSEDTTGGIYL